MIHILRRRWKTAVAYIVCLVIPVVWLCAILPFGFTTLQLINMGLLLTLLGLLLIILQQGLEDRRAFELSQEVISDELAERATTLEKAVDARSVIAQKTVEQTAKVLAVKVEETSEGIHDTVKDTGEHLADLIKDNTRKTEQATAAAKEAFKEANNVNEKISDLNERLLQESKDRKSDQ